eukprot:s1015_g2.t1
MILKIGIADRRATVSEGTLILICKKLEPAWRGIAFKSCICRRVQGGTRQKLIRAAGASAEGHQDHQSRRFRPHGWHRVERRAANEEALADGPQEWQPGGRIAYLKPRYLTRYSAFCGRGAGCVLSLGGCLMNRPRLVRAGF